jgi:hypothetical protein
VSFENKIDENGDRLIWLERRWVEQADELSPGGRELLGRDFAGCGGGVMAEVLGTWAGLDRRVGPVRRWLLDKPEMEPEALAEVRARLERVLATLVAGGRVRIERPRMVDDLRGLLAEIDRRAASPGSQARHDVASRYAKRAGSRSS